MKFISDFWRNYPILASALVMAAGAFSMNCGVMSYDPEPGLPRGFNSIWSGRSILMTTSVDDFSCLNYVRCRFSDCSYGSESRIYYKDGHSAIIGVSFEQELSEGGDALVLLNNSGGEIFRVNSGDELYGDETEIVDRDNPAKKFELLDAAIFPSCTDYLDSLGIPLVQP